MRRQQQRAVKIVVRSPLSALNAAAAAAAAAKFKIKTWLLRRRECAERKRFMKEGRKLPSPHFNNEAAFSI